MTYFEFLARKISELLIFLIVLAFIGPTLHTIVGTLYLYRISTAQLALATGATAILSLWYLGATLVAFPLLLAFHGARLRKILFVFPAALTFIAANSLSRWDDPLIGVTTSVLLTATFAALFVPFGQGLR